MLQSKEATLRTESQAKKFSDGLLTKIKVTKIITKLPLYTSVPQISKSTTQIKTIAVVTVSNMLQNQCICPNVIPCHGYLHPPSPHQHNKFNSNFKN
jgi:hypothetical protein